MIGLPPSFGAVQLTTAAWLRAEAVTAVGAAGAVAPLGIVTEFDWAETGPLPVPLAAWTVNV